MDQPVSESSLPQTRSRRITRQLSTHLRVVVTATMLVLAMGAGMGIDRFLISSTSADQTQADSLEDTELFGVLQDTYDVIRDQYVLSDEISDETLIYGAAAGMVEALGDTGHSRFLTPEEAAAEAESESGEFVGVGISMDLTGPLPVVQYAFPGSPAEAAGILPGDTIVAIDGESLRDTNLSESTSVMRGDEGTDVVLTVLHEGQSDPVDITITRAKITYDYVSWTMLPGNIAWVQITQFVDNVDDELRDALETAEAQGATGVILDLRNNPGGYTIQAQAVASQFLSDGDPIVQEIDRDQNTTITRVRGNEGAWLEKPVVVLVNQYSASSSEIVASAIQDNDRGLVVGEVTAGTGTTLITTTLDDGSEILMGVSLFLTAGGNSIYHTGVQPDQAAYLDSLSDLTVPGQYSSGSVTDAQYADSPDAQLKAAYDVLTSGDAGN